MHLPLAFIACTSALFSSPAYAKECEVTAEQAAEASKLDWKTFDQTGGVAGSFRDLASRQCFKEALDAYREWLNFHGDFPNQRARGIGKFHIGQALAFTGNATGAVAMIGQSFRDTEIEGDVARDWNAYVDGVLGFFTGDRARIREARKKLFASDRAFARRQIDILDGLLNCIGQPYSKAMSGSCRD